MRKNVNKKLFFVNSKKKEKRMYYFLLFLDHQLDVLRKIEHFFSI